MVEKPSAFVSREHFRENPEVHVAGICVDPTNGKILIARRSPHKELYPGLWEGCGGQLARGESFSEGVKRHFHIELGIVVLVSLYVFALYEIPNADGTVIPGIRFLCRQVGNASPASIEHSEIRWVGYDDVASMAPTAFPPELKVDILHLADECCWAKIRDFK